jgi:transposase
LEKLLSQRNRGKASRDRRIAEAVTAHVYSQMEVARFLMLHYSTISRILTVIKRTSTDALDELQMRGRRKFFAARTSVPT